jgi:phosphoglycerol transferase MdoB-like AlkP superfamily enzyme
MAQPQSYGNHTRRDPAFHFFVMPLLLLNLIFAIYATIHAWPWFKHSHLWWIVMSIVLLQLALTVRHYALRNQNRIIRLEEQLRLADLLPEEQLGLIDALTMEQFIALRFASDAEVSELARRAVFEKLTPPQIKESIVSWRADDYRV